MDWAKPPELRDQLVLFPRRLDDAIAQDHNVRLLDDILGRLDWSSWEAAYDLRRGQPPIHPRVLAGVILYGLLTRIRTSRALEEALQVRLDFRWLVEGRSIDHTTLSEFRRKNGDALKTTFVQIGLVAREIGCLPLETLAFDGTRVRANNRRSGSRTPARLREMKAELAAKFAELEAKTAAADVRDDEVFGNESNHTLSQELADVERRRYKSAAEDCAACPLRDLCLQGQAKRRTISREQHESHREAHAAKMATDEGKEKYNRRRHPGERPFAVIKHQFGARQFLLRGLEPVKQEWLWLCSAFNLNRLFGLIRSGADPPSAAT
jgi:transposase